LRSGARPFYSAAAPPGWAGWQDAIIGSFDGARDNLPVYLRAAEAGRLAVSHDLAVVRQLTDEAIVLHRGEIVERGRTAQILDDPQHPYTQRLRASVPRPGWKQARRA
jgi:ABC-type glutathione transport system ATPase component